MNKIVEKYSDIKDSDCVFLSGIQLKDMASSSGGFCQLSFEIVENNIRVKNVNDPYSEFDDDKIYKCYDYSHISGRGVEYRIIAILNY